MQRLFIFTVFYFVMVLSGCVKPLFFKITPVTTHQPAINLSNTNSLMLNEIAILYRQVQGNSRRRMTATIDDRRKEELRSSLMHRLETLRANGTKITLGTNGSDSLFAFTNHSNKLGFPRYEEMKLHFSDGIKLLVTHSFFGVHQIRIGNTGSADVETLYEFIHVKDGHIIGYNAFSVQRPANWKDRQIRYKDVRKVFEALGKITNRPDLFKLHKP